MKPKLTASDGVRPVPADVAQRPFLESDKVLTLQGFEAFGQYWTSNVDNGSSRVISFDLGNVNFYSVQRKFGNSVRCIKDY